jgi:hypothetical protein
MSDYFLNKIYDSLLVNKAPKTKSAFRTLSESYNLVYEDETNTAQPAQQLQVQQEQPVQVTPSLKNNQTVSGFNIKEIYHQKWTPEQKNLYNIRPEGVGPGELAVASALLNNVDEQACAELISGPTKAYDVSYPSKDKPEVIFEVKQLTEEGKDSVRIAKHGAQYAKIIAADVVNILDDIIYEYELLDNENKQYINNYIVSQIPDIVMAKAGRVKTPQKPSSVIAKQKAEERYRQQQIHKEQWTVDRWAYGIKNNAVEIPFSLLFSDQPIDISREGFDDEKTEDLAETSLFISIQKFVNLIEQLEEGNVEVFKTKQTQETTPKINALNQVFKDFYSAATANPEQQTKLNQELNKAAIETDKKLTKIKTEITGTDKKQMSHFVNKVKSLNLKERLNNLKTKTNDPQLIRSLFPKDKNFGGLFIVNPNSFHYAPADKLHDVIQVEQISVGRPKIGFKK